MNHRILSLSLSLSLIPILFFACIIPPAHAATLTKPANNLGLVGYWSFNEATGTIAHDFSGSGNNGTLTNGAAWASGKLGSALNFNGSNGYVDVGSSVPFDSNNWTLSLWADASNVNGTYQRLLSYYNNGPTIWEIAGSGALSIVHDGTIDFDMGITLTNNSWTHIVVTRQGSTIIAYKDGIQTAQNTSFSVTFTNDTSVRIGYATSFDNPYSGSLDDVRIYNRALSAAEVQALYASGSAKINSSPANLVTKGLIGWWTFDGGSITDKIYDSSGNGHNGYFINGATSTAKIIGKLGQALSFDGIDDYAQVGGISDLDLSGTNQISLSGWIYPTAAQNYPSIIAKQDGGGGEYGLTYGNNTNLKPSLWLNLGGDWGSRVDAIGAIPLNQWTYVTATYDGSNAKIYINGLLNNTAAASGNLAENSDNVYIGMGNSTNFIAKGSIDDVRIYNRALSATEVQQLYNAGLGTKINTAASNLTKGTTLDSGLVGYWSFNGTDFTDKVYDRSGQGNDGYVVGIATSSAKAIGKSGQGLNFTTAGDFVSFGQTGMTQILNSSTQPFSISVWWKPASFGGGGNSILVGRYGYNSGMMVTNDGMKLSFYNAAHTLQYGVSGSCSGLGQWCHGVGVYDGNNNMSLYINGQLADTGVWSGGNIEAGAPIKIGQDQYYFLGVIDEVRIYNRALSASEVKQLYLLGK
jgi:hypothetical protein